MVRNLCARVALFGAFVASSAAGGCGSSSGDPPPKADVPLDTDESIVAGGAPSLCVGVRGNGHYIVTHFASMSRIVETYGVPHGVAGGSSGSITQFVYESILMSPVIRRCAGKACTGTEESARVALALKSLEGYGEALVTSDEAVAVADLVGLVVKLKDEVDKRGIKALLSTDTVEATKRLKEVLAIPEVKDLVNPEILDLLSSPSRATWAAKDVYTSIVTLGAFSPKPQDLTSFSRTATAHCGSAMPGLRWGNTRRACNETGRAPTKPSIWNWSVMTHRQQVWLKACATSPSSEFRWTRSASPAR